MIIDVFDLNFEKLRFSKRYDQTRYNRGKKKITEKKN